MIRVGGGWASAFLLFVMLLSFSLGNVDRLEGAFQDTPDLILGGMARVAGPELSLN